jgi:hypothetical protein
LGFIERLGGVGGESGLWRQQRAGTARQQGSDEEGREAA